MVLDMPGTHFYVSKKSIKLHFLGVNGYSMLILGVFGQFGRWLFFGCG